MPFCTNCGNKVNPNASFCHNCGQAQPRVASHSAEFLDTLNDRTASILCYVPVFGIIPAIVFLASRRFRLNSTVRFNAFQSLYLFVTWLIVSTAAPSIFRGFFPGHALFGIVKLGMFICWMFLLVRAAQDVIVRLPVIGDLAARSAAEQV